jgi:CDP-diacylglycerol--serine O-phosphatidyltransferase
MFKLMGVYSYQLHFGNERLTQIFERAVLLIAIVFAMCAIIRLARFNVETAEESAHLSFAGLPTPPAAGLVVSMVIFQQDFLPHVVDWPNGLFRALELTTLWGLPVVTLIAGLLMVSRIPYPHVMNRLLRGRKRFSTFLLVVLALLLAIWNIQLAMVVGFCTFVLYGLIRWLIIVLSPKKNEVRTEAP